ncbi:MAG: TldD/PmbA family protein [Firmicutes bacterium]|nr:TldD/PmbA family protein [Bacillota bacterium]
MLSQNLLSELLGIGLSSGADFAEVFAENTLESQMTLTGGSVESIADRRLSGMGFRLLKGTKSVYASTSDLSRSGLINCAKSAAQALGSLGEAGHVVLHERVFPDIHGIRIVPSTVDAADKAALLHRAYDSAKAYSKEIVQAQARILDIDRNILIANSEGLLTQDRQIRTRLSVNAVASNGSENQSGSCAPGARMGMELYELKTPEMAGEEAARQAVTMLHAGYAPAGNMAVAIENGFGGVIFHEACGHSLEATSVATGRSQFCGKLGQQIASPIVTAIDDGTEPNSWGSNNIDDEGHPTQKLVLIENGILKNYLIDRLGSRRMGMPATGCGRRQNYHYEPTSRMSNTYIAAGKDDREEIIGSMDYGLYAAAMGGGSVNPVTGEFNFAVREAYMIRDGKIAEPVRGATLIGKGSEILPKIDRISSNLDSAQGMCGSKSGSIPTNVGQPLIRVSSITVGGR